MFFAILVYVILVKSGFIKYANCKKYFKEAANLGLVEVVELNAPGEDQAIEEFEEEADLFPNPLLMDYLGFLQRMTFEIESEDQAIADCLLRNEGGVPPGSPGDFQFPQQKWQRICAAELRHMLINLGELPGEVVDEIFRKVNIDQDTQIDFDKCVSIFDYSE